MEVEETGTTSTTAVPRVVGEPLDSWIVITASLAVLALVLVAGIIVSRRLRAADRPEK